MTFYLFKDNHKLGPYSVEQIHLFLRQGLVTMETEVWSDGWSSWAPIRNVPALTGGAAEPSVPQTQPTPPNHPVPQAGSVSQQFPTGFVEGKEPVLACVLSLLIVGSGQAYNGEWAKGAFLLATCVGASWFSCGTAWFVWAVASAIDAYRVAAKLKPANSWNWWA